MYILSFFILNYAFYHVSLKEKSNFACKSLTLSESFWWYDFALRKGSCDWFLTLDWQDIDWQTMMWLPVQYTKYWPNRVHGLCWDGTTIQWLDWSSLTFPLWKLDWLTYYFHTQSNPIQSDCKIIFSIWKNWTWVLKTRSSTVLHTTQPLSHKFRSIWHRYVGSPVFI